MLPGILIQILLLFNVLFLVVFPDLVIDLTIIGHTKGWKKIKYPKRLNNFIVKTRLGRDLLMDDCTTHPQVLCYLALMLVIQAGSIWLDVFFIRDKNFENYDTWVLLVTNLCLYIPTIVWSITSHFICKSKYYKYLDDKYKKPSSSQDSEEDITKDVDTNID